MIKFSRTIAISALSFAALSSVHAQAAMTPAPAAPLLKIGDVAPDFTMTSVTKNGVDKPFHLAEHKGETVVLAFFPKARTSGCTTQMHAYRDQYDKVFMGGKKVTLVGISIDADTALISWAKDDGFPFHFGADTDRKVGMAYGANMGTGYHKRLLYVVDPKGRISYIAAPLLQMAETAYTDLATAVTNASGHK